MQNEGEIFDQDPNDPKRGAVPCHAFQVWGTDGEVNYTQIDSNGEWPSYSSYPMDPNNTDPTKLVFHVFLLSASCNTGSNISGVLKGAKKLLKQKNSSSPLTSMIITGKLLQIPRLIGTVKCSTAAAAVM